MAALPLYVHLPKFYGGTLGVDLALLGAVLLVLRLADGLARPAARRVERPRCRSRRAADRAVARRCWPSAWSRCSCRCRATDRAAARLARRRAGARLLRVLGGDDQPQRLGRRARRPTRSAAHADHRGARGPRARRRRRRERRAGAARRRRRRRRRPRAVRDRVRRCSRSPAPRSPCARRRAAPRRRERRAAGAGVAAPLADPLFRRLLVVFLANGIASAIPATLVLFFIADVLQAESAAGPVPRAVLRRRRRRHAAVGPAVRAPAARCERGCAGMVAAIVAFVWAFALGPGDTVAFAAICVLSGLALGADLALPPSLLADVIDRDGRARPTGAYFGLWTLATKLNLALAAGIALPLLAVAGLRARRARPAAAGVRSPSSTRSLPCVLKLGALVALYRFRNRRQRKAPAMILKTTFAVLAIAGLAGCASIDVAQLPGREARARPRALLQRHRRRLGHVPGPLRQGRQALHRAHRRPLGRRQRHARRALRVSPTARSRTASGSSSRTATATPAPPPTSSARARARPPAMRCNLELRARAAGRRQGLERGHGRLDVPDRRADACSTARRCPSSASASAR